MADIFTDPDFDTPPAPEYFGPMTKPIDIVTIIGAEPKVDTAAIIGVPSAPAVTHDDDGTIRTANVPSGDQLIATMNAQRDKFTARVKSEQAAVDQRRADQSAAYLAAARCLAESEHSLTTAQMKHLRRLAGQIHRAGTSLRK